MEINKLYSTEMETFAELEKDQHNLCLFVASATAVNKSGCGTVVMFGLELKTMYLLWSSWSTIGICAVGFIQK